MPELVPRHHILAFYGVPDTSGNVTFYRMQYFTNLGKNKNPNKYTRKYVDEKSSRSDVTSYAETNSYTFDRYRGNAVHEDIISISDRELVGTDAVRTCFWVDIDTNKAVKRDYAVIPDSEASDANTYTHSGSLEASGEPVFGTATSSDNWLTATFTEDT
ncbi:MAG: hypothetical protein IJJ69_04065 [Oscillospiraceae bacterium]|nr:hypothetical protein [Oscillospiraceae bacterium]